MQTITVPGLDFGRLHSASVIQAASDQGSSAVEEIQIENCLLRAARASILYIPMLRLQVHQSQSIPTEVVAPHEWKFLQSCRHGHGTSLEQPFLAQVYTEDVCILSNLFSTNFFHWTTEEMAKVLILEQAGFHGSYALHNMPSFCFQLLEGFGIPPSRILLLDDQPRFFQCAVVLPAVNLHSDSVRDHFPIFLLLRNKLLTLANRSLAPTPRRIWLERRSHVGVPRIVVNMDEIQSILERHGFIPVDFAEHPVTDQISIAMGTEIILGPHGSGFLHTLFMNPGSTVIECFSPEHVNSQAHWAISFLLKHRYLMVVPRQNAYSPYPYGGDIRIDPLQLELALQTIGLQ